MIDAALFALLRCPVTLQPLRLAAPEILNRLIPPLEGALVRADGRVAYPIRDGIPMLLPAEAIPLDPPAT